MRKLPWFGRRFVRLSSARKRFLTEIRGHIDMSTRIIRIVVPALFFFLAAWGSAQTNDSINFGTTFQTIRGFGTSTAWQPVMPSALVNGLFGTGSGQVGLTILRSRIDPSSTTGGSNWAT